jgi:hypothetical protein
MLPGEVLRVVLEERIAFGPDTRRPVTERIRGRLPELDAEMLALALGEAQHAITDAEALAQEFVAGVRTQGEVVAELRSRFPWLVGDVAPGSGRRAARRDGAPDLVDRLGNYGHFLALDEDT